MKTKITECAIAYEADAIQYRGEDGIYSALRPQVGVTTATARYIKPNAYSVKWSDEGGAYLVWEYDYLDAQDIAKLINDYGCVDLDGWIEIEADDLEARFYNEWEREQVERAEMGGF